jgi:hypothetical protein
MIDDVDLAVFPFHSQRLDRFRGMRLEFPRECMDNEVRV